MKKASQTKVDKTGLHEMLLTASNMAGREDTYTADTLKTLNSAINCRKERFMITAVPPRARSIHRSKSFPRQSAD